MADTPVEVHCPTGLTSHKLFLYAVGSDVLGNTGGDDLTESTNAKGVYQATVTESLVGEYNAVVKDGAGVGRGLFRVTLADDTNLYTCQEPSTAAIPGDSMVAGSIANNAITTASIADGAVTADKLASGVITTAKIADGAITSAKFTVSAISGVATGILEKIDQLWRRFFKKTTKSSTEIKTYADDNTAVLTTQTHSTTGSDQNVGAAS